MSRQFYIIWIACLAIPLLAWIASEIVITDVRFGTTKSSGYMNLRRGTLVLQTEFLVQTELTFAQTGHRIRFNREALSNPHITGLRSWWLYAYRKTYSSGAQQIFHLRIPLWMPLLTILIAGGIPLTVHYRRRRSDT